jgi:hypothetical protein
MAPEVRRVTIKDGSFTFLDTAGGLLASFKGLDFRTSIRSASALHGQAKVKRISLRNRFYLEELRSPLRYEPDVLELSKISARAANGEINGYFAMQPEAEDSPFTTVVKFHDVLADEIVENAGGSKGTVKGKLEGSFQAEKLLIQTRSSAKAKFHCGTDEFNNTAYWFCSVSFSRSKNCKSFIWNKPRPNII